jgi:hypothetical protein
LGVKREVDTVMRNQAERILRDPTWSAPGIERSGMARLAREENEALKRRTPRWRPSSVEHDWILWAGWLVDPAERRIFVIAGRDGHPYPRRACCELRIDRNSGYLYSQDLAMATTVRR